MSLEPIWNEQRTTMLKDLLAAGLTFGEISIRISRETRTSLTRNACIGRASRLKLISKNRPGGTPNPDSIRRRKPKVPNELRVWHRKQMSIAPVSREPAAKDFLAVTLMDLQPGQCRYPRGDKTILFCGQPAMKESSYCAHCHWICHTARPTPTDDKTKARAAATVRKLLGPAEVFSPNDVAA